MKKEAVFTLAGVKHDHNIRMGEKSGGAGFGLEI